MKDSLSPSSISTGLRPRLATRSMKTLGYQLLWQRCSELKTKSTSKRLPKRRTETRRWTCWRCSDWTCWRCCSWALRCCTSLRYQASTRLSSSSGSAQWTKLMLLLTKQTHLLSMNVFSSFGNGRRIRSPRRPSSWKKSKSTNGKPSALTGNTEKRLLFKRQRRRARGKCHWAKWAPISGPLKTIATWSISPSPPCTTVKVKSSMAPSITARSCAFQPTRSTNSTTKSTIDRRNSHRAGLKASVSAKSKSTKSKHPLRHFSMRARSRSSALLVWFPFNRAIIRFSLKILIQPSQRNWRSSLSRSITTLSWTKQQSQPCWLICLTKAAAWKTFRTSLRIGWMSRLWASPRCFAPSPLPPRCNAKTKLWTSS